MTSRPVAVALLAALVAVGVLAVVSSAHGATFTAACPTAPGDAESSTDAAIEVRELRQETAAMCDALVERLAFIADALDGTRVEVGEEEVPALAVALSSEDAGRVDLIWWAVWLIPGLTLGLMVGSRFFVRMRNFA